MAAVTEQNPPKAQTKAAPKKLAVLRAEVILLLVFVLLGMGVWLLVERGVARLLGGYEPREEQAQLRYGVQWKQDGLAMTQSEQKATQEQLIQARLDFYKHEAELEALDARPSKQADEAAKKREEALAQRDAAARHVNILIERLDLLQETANGLRSEVERSRREAAQEFATSTELDKGRVVFKLAKLVITFFATAILLLVVYAFMALPMWRYSKRARRSGYETNSVLLLTAVAGLLLVLIAYQTFEFAGAAFAGALLLLIFLTTMTWPERGEAAQK